MILDAMGHALELLGLPVIAMFVLLPLAFIGTWAAAEPELTSWPARRIALYWIVVPGATLGTLVVLAPLAALVLAGRFVALILLTGFRSVRRGGWKALPAPRG